jgi:transcriptional regulator with XRE-family HTH domain
MEWTMVTMAQRIEELRTQRGLSRPALSAALGFPKNTAEKFETGRLTPTREQQEKLASYFGVSLFYLKGESSDPTRQEDWMEDGWNEEEPEPAAPPKRAVRAQAARPGQEQSTVFDALLGSKAFQDLVRSTVLEVLRSPEGQAILSRTVRKELDHL